MPGKFRLLAILVFLLALVSCTPLGRPIISDNSAGSFSFVVLGDTKIYADENKRPEAVVLDKLIKQINQLKPELVFYLGDGPHDGGPVKHMKAYRQYLEKISAPWYPVIGNHELLKGASEDGKNGNGPQNFLSVFADRLQDKGAAYYSVEFKQARFIILNTALMDAAGGDPDGLNPDGKQWVWLKDQLSSARSKGQKTFVLGHVPPFVPAGSEYKITWTDLKAAQQFMRLMEEFKVAAVFSGHFHAFRELSLNNVTYLITGGAGADLYAKPEEGGYFHFIQGQVEGDKFTYTKVPLES